MRKPIKAKIGIAIILSVLSVSMIMIFTLPLVKTKLTFKSIYSDESKVLVDLAIEELLKADASTLKNHFSATIENIENGLEQLDEFLASNPIIEYDLINVGKSSFTNSKQKTSYEKFEFSTVHQSNYGHLLIETIKINDELKLNTIRLNPLSIEIIEMNKFYKDDFGLVRIFILILTIFVFALLGYTIIDYYKSSNNPKILIMILLMISGLMINIDWNTLHISIKLFAVSLFPIAEYRPGNSGVWQFKIYFPVFTILYWVFLKKKILNKEMKKEEKLHIKDIDPDDEIIQ